jgi:hypothetical protein
MSAESQSLSSLQSMERDASALESGRVEDAARKVYRLLADAIEALGGLDVAAGVCGIDRADLRRGVDRAGRYVRVEHAIALGARVARYNPTLATKLGSALVEAFGLEVFPRVTLTDRERADRLEALVRRMPLGDQLLAEALGGKR